MKVTIYLKDPNSTAEMPVVAMGFTRKDSAATTLPDYLPNPTTGSIAPAE